MEDSAVLQTTLQCLGLARVPTLQAVLSHFRRPKSGTKAVLHDRIVLELTQRKIMPSFRADCASVLMLCGVAVPFSLPPATMGGAPPAPQPAAMGVRQVSTLPAAPASAPLPLIPATRAPPQSPAVNWNPWASPAGIPSAVPSSVNRRGCPCGLPSSSGPCVKCASPGCGTKYHVRCLSFPTPSPPPTWRCAVCRAAGMMPFAELQQARRVQGALRHAAPSPHPLLPHAARS